MSPIRSEAPIVVPHALRCEYRRDPLGLDVLAPRLDWRLSSPRRGERQTAYQVLVATSPDSLAADRGDLWDSGRVASDRSIQVAYAGLPLASRQRCWWKVRLWNRDGSPSAWSETATWSMGLLLPGDWTAAWMGCADERPDAGSAPDDAEGLARPRYLRTAFAVEAPVRRATVYATALGLYELRLNGSRVGDRLLTPEWTAYGKRVMYQTYDVTAQVRQGGNALGVALGNGWYCGNWQKWKPQLSPIYGVEPYALIQLEIERADGSLQVVTSGADWRGTTGGPIRFAGIYEGETIDARRGLGGWDQAGFADAGWLPASAATPVVGALVGQRGEPIRALRTLKPIALAEPQPGVFVFAFAQNLVGWCRFTCRGRAGQVVELQHGEMRHPDGTVFTGNLCVVSEHRVQLDRYILRGDGAECFEPHFTYHGFQYVEVRGLTEAPTLDDLVGVAFNSDCPEVGNFTCSDPLLDRLVANIRWSQRGNYMGVPTDCPQRNERCGYTGDAQFFMRAAVYNMDVAAFFTRWLVDVCQDAQMPDGHFADHAPTFGPGDGPNIGWSDAGIICPYEIWRTYGDTRIIREHYAAMKRNLDWLEANTRDGIFVGKVGNGDWLSNGGGACPEVIGTAYAAYDAQLMAEMATAIGEEADAGIFRQRAERIASAFAQAYIEADGRIARSSQSGYALAFTMGLVPEALRGRMAERFAEEVHRFDWHPRTGFIGTPRLLPGLHLAGRDDDAYRLLLTRTAPSWLYPLSVGATTIWERWVAWDGQTPQGGMNSLNHYAFGAVGEYLFGAIGGIQPLAPGYKVIGIAPVIRDGLTWAAATYDSIHGPIACTWRVDEHHLDLQVSIPANTTAEVTVPAAEAALVREDGQPAERAEGVCFLRAAGGGLVYAVDSGAYHFTVDRRR